MIGSHVNQYEILEKIGSGGQGAVYRARDTKLDRTAVVKVLPPELTTKTSNFKRFEREAQLCSQLDHQNICTIYDFSHANNVYYIAMQYVEGKNVRQLVAGRPLEIKSAVSIALQVCNALAYAHSKNIIHRDIKAGNVMVTPRGQVKILDFGLAKLIEDEYADASGSHDITELGIPYGTATYAAPEQAMGQRADHRADIFSTGVLLYEMLTGIWAFQGKTVVDVRHQVLHGTPRPVADARKEEVPVLLQQIIDKALQKDPNDRYQKIDKMEADLRTALQQVTGSSPETPMYAPSHAEERGVMKKAWGWLTGKSNETPSTPTFTVTHSTGDVTQSTAISDKKSVAILPFKNLSNDADANFYEFALADAVITELARLKSLIVRSSSLIAKYQGVGIDPREAGKELRVDAVLSAGFLRSGERMRVTAQLLDVISGEILWSDRIDAEGSDILAIQDNIAHHILEGLRLELSEKEQERLGKKPTEIAEAWEEYLRGRDSFGRFIFRTLAKEDFDAAVSNFRHAIDLDPHFALAHSGLGACYVNRIFKGMGGPEDYTLAEASFSRAFKSDPNVVEARVLNVMIYLARGEKKKARAEIELLQKQFPNEAPLYFVKGTMDRLDGKYDEALRSFEKLGRLDPAALVVASYNRSRIFAYQGKYDEAIKEIKKGEIAEPGHPMVRIFNAAVEYYCGSKEKALQIIRDVLADKPQMDGIKPLYAVFLAGSGKPEEAREQLTDTALNLSRADHDMAYWVASTYALLGENDLAFKWLGRAIKLGNENRPWFNRDESWNVLRKDPRFNELLTKCHDCDS